MIIPVRTWPDVLLLAVTEIREYDGGSIQVVRRLHALLDELRELVFPGNRAAIDLDTARTRDCQEIGGAMRRSDMRRRNEG